MIRAKAWTDDRRIEIEFDATPWFQDATEQEVNDLIECGYRGDYPADAVILYMADTVEDPAAVNLFRYIELVEVQPNGETLGFECAVNGDDANEWLKTHRPDWV